MKKIKLFTKCVMLVLSVITFMTLIATQADAKMPWSHMTKSYCTVTSEFWEYPPKGELTAPIALYHASVGPAHADYACRDEIHLAVKEIALEGSFVIGGTGTEGDYHVVRGGCTTGDEDSNGQCDGNALVVKLLSMPRT